MRHDPAVLDADGADPEGAVSPRHVDEDDPGQIAWLLPWMLALAGILLTMAVFR
jgi:hypothetical protein